MYCYVHVLHLLDVDNICWHICSADIDYTSGDIDATLSMHSWSYEARDLSRAESLNSIPAQMKGTRVHTPTQR